MMNKKSGGTGMFMMEMIMVVFFFILCASTCILVFAKSNNMSVLAKDTNKGVVAAESVAEVWKAEGLKGLNERYSITAAPDVVTDLEQGTCSIFWDKDWKNSETKSDAAYSAELAWSTADGICEAKVDIIRLADGLDLYNLPVKKYLGNRE